MNKLYQNIIIGLAVIVFIFLLIFGPDFRIAPKGTPKNYYEVLDQVNEYGSGIFLMGDSNLLDEDLVHNEITSLDSVPKNQTSRFVIIDFDMYNDFEQTDFKKIESYYVDYCTYFILLNYDKNDLEQLNHLIDDEDEGSNFFMLDFNECNGHYYSKTIEGYSDEVSNLFRYQIMHIVRNKLKYSYN